MTNTPRNTGNTRNTYSGRENNEAQQRQNNKNIVTLAIKDFVNTNLDLYEDKAKALEFYRKAKTDPKYKKKGWKDDFLEFKNRNEDYDKILKKDVEDKDKIFLREVAKFSIGFETGRANLKELIKKDYKLTSDQENNLNSKIEEFTKKNIDDYLINPSKIDELVKSVFAENCPKKIDYLDFLNSFDLKDKTLSQEQKDSIELIRGGNYILKEHVSKILPLFDSIEEKQKFIRAFVPTISLGKLVELNIIEEEKMKGSLKRIIDNNRIIFKDFKISSGDEDFLNLIDIENIVIPTNLFPEEELNKVFGTKGIEMITEEINDLKDKIDEENKNNKIKFKADSNGNITADFIEKVKADPNLNQKIIGIENLKEGCVLKITEKNPENNEDIVNYFKINTLDYGKETLPRVKLTNITSSSGQIKKNTSASDEEDISYNDFYKLFQKINKGEIIKEEDFEKKKESGEIKEVIEDGKINTIEQLVEKLNEIDPEGISTKFEKGLSFEIFGEEKGAKYGIFSISKLDENTRQIWVTNGQKEEGPFSYSDFLNLFETQEGKRFNPTGNIIGVLENIKTQSASDIQKGFENIEYDKDRKILIPTDKKEDKDFLGIEYFMNPKTGKAIKIQDLGENKLKLSFGEYKEAPKKDNDKDVQKPDVFKMESNPEICGYEMLYFLIQKHGCIPKIPKAEVKDKEVKDPPPMKGGFFKSWLSGVSVAQIIAGGKQFIDAIKHKLDQGSKINAARFALGLGKILPIGDNIRLDLKSSVYAADKKLIEEISGEICNLSTGDAVTRIKGILFNRGSPQYELFAGMIAALTKIGTIYPGELKNYRNNYMWYRAFGGTPNDKFMKSIMEEYKISGKQFNEENLMIEYFKKNSGPLGIRPTFFIDVIVAGNTGRSTNMKNGDNESKGMFTTDGKVDHTVKKLGDGEYYNALGAFKNIISQGGDSKQMYKFPFIMVMSGLVKNLNQEQIKEELKDQYLKSNPFPPLLFMESNEDIKLFQRVIIKLSSCISEEARKEAQEIVQFSKDPSTYKHPKDNKLNGLKGYVGLVSNFWDKHGDKLAPKMALTKDIEIYTKKDQDTDYKKYFNKIQGVAKDSEFLIKGEKIQAGFYNYNHSSVAIVDIENYLEKGVRNINSQGGMSDTGKQIFDQIIIGIDDIKNKKPFGTDEKANKSFQKQLFFNYHKGINKFIMGQSISSEKFKSTEYGTKLEKRNITIVETNRKDSSYLETEKYKQTVNTDFENYLISKQKTTNTTETTKEDTKRSVNKIITSQPFGSTKIQPSTKPSGPKKSTKNNEGNSEDEEENE